MKEWEASNQDTGEFFRFTVETETEAEAALEVLARLQWVVSEYVPPSEEKE